MNTENIQALWQQYNEKLEKNLQLNKELIRKMNLEGTQRVMKTPLWSEILGICAITPFIIWILISMPRLSTETPFLICGIISITCMLVSFTGSIIKIKYLSAINYINTPILQLQKQLTEFKRIVKKWRKTEFIVVPILVLSLLPTVNKIFNSINILERPIYFASCVVGALVIGFPLSLWINKRFYDDQITAANQYLKELENFEKEE